MIKPSRGRVVACDSDSAYGRLGAFVVASIRNQPRICCFFFLPTHVLDGGIPLAPVA